MLVTTVLNHVLVGDSSSVVDDKVLDRLCHFLGIAVHTGIYSTLRILRIVYSWFNGKSSGKLVLLSSQKNVEVICIEIESKQVLLPFIEYIKYHSVGCLGL